MTLSEYYSSSCHTFIMFCKYRDSSTIASQAGQPGPEYLAPAKAAGASDGAEPKDHDATNSGAGGPDALTPVSDADPPAGWGWRTEPRRGCRYL
jgi:hypothetical protein